MRRYEKGVLKVIEWGNPETVNEFMAELQSRGRTNKIGEFMSKAVVANDPERIAKLQAQDGQEQLEAQLRERRAQDRAAKSAQAQQVRLKPPPYISFPLYTS